MLAVFTNSYIGSKTAITTLCNFTQCWLQKINCNKANDAKAARALKKDGCKVITVWECKLKPAKVEKTLADLILKLESKK